MRIEDRLRAAARAHPDRLALIARETRLDYAALDALTERFAAGLAARGVAPGDRVVIALDNVAEAAIAIWGALKAGAVFVVASPAARPERLAALIGDCAPAALIGHRRCAATIAAALERAPAAARPFCVALEGGAGEGVESFVALLADAPTPVQVGAEGDLAALIYTSGSTGRPKGVMMTHANIEAAAGALVELFANTPDDVIFSVLPISFNYGLYQLLMAHRVGATLALERSFAFPRDSLLRMAALGATGFPLTPTIAALTLAQKNLDPALFARLRYVTNTAAALTPAQADGLSALFAQARIFSMFGLTECKRATCLPPRDLKRKPGSVGLAMPNVSLRLIDEAGAEVGPRMIGELTVAGPTVMQGYWRDPDATARALRRRRDGAIELRTGDLMWRDEEGYHYFVGRRDDIIKTRGEKVAPVEVETVISQIEGVAEVVVIGVPDSVLGHALKAVVALHPGARLDARAVRAACAARLEPHKAPQIVEFRQSLAKTETGKLSRRLAGRPVETAS